jgi:DNA-directed RNA polymerase I subunit RPA2
MTDPFAPSVRGNQNICVQLDGRIIGWAKPSVAKSLATSLRIWKTEGIHNIPLDLKLVWYLPSEGGQYPGLFLFASRSRMMRPVKYVVNGKDDQIGSFEQVYMDIAISPNEIETGSLDSRRTCTDKLSLDFSQHDTFLGLQSESPQHLSMSGAPSSILSR